MDRQDVTELCERARRACDEIATVQQALNATRQETAALLARAHELPSLGPCVDAAQPVNQTPPSAPLACIEPATKATSHEAPMEVLRMMRALLEGFPVEMQVSIVKALTARTMVVVAAQLRAPLVTSSA